QLIDRAGSLLPRKEKIGLRGQAALQTGGDRFLDRNRGLERDPRCRDPRAAGVEAEVAPGHGEGDFLQLAVECEVGAQELLAATLQAGGGRPKSTRIHLSCSWGVTPGPSTVNVPPGARSATREVPPRAIANRVG